MQIETARFGQIEVDSSKIISLDQGLIGFPEERRFCILEDERWGPLRWLQSVERPELAFLVVNPYEFFVDYEVLIDDEVAKILHAAEDRARRTLQQHAQQLYKLAQALCQRESLDEQEVAELIGPSVQQMPERSRTAGPSQVASVRE